MNAASVKWCDDPGRAYRQYCAAIERRDVESVLAQVSDSYGRHLRAAHQKGRFPALFELWCETFPRLVDVVACFIDGDCATVEMRLKCDGKIESGYATLLRRDDSWCVDFERRANGSTRIPSGRAISDSRRLSLLPLLAAIGESKASRHSAALRGAA